MQLKKDMQKEINKYQGSIYIYYKNTNTILSANWIKSLSDYNHYAYELHHVVPYTDWENNTKKVQSKTKNALILLPRIMHQHLENPLYKLSKEKFQEIYGINPDAILYDVNSKLERTCELFFTQQIDEELEDFDCFADCNLKDELAKYEEYKGVNKISLEVDLQVGKYSEKVEGKGEVCAR